MRTATALTGYFREMYRAEAAMVSPKKVIRVLKEAKVRFVLMGTHGLSGWRSRARATQDVDVLVAKKDHAKAVRAVRKAFPRLLVEDSLVVTRFTDPWDGEPRIDLMKPLHKVDQIVFRHTQMVADSHRIRDLEMALISKFAAMTSPYRHPPRKMQDAADFADMIVHNQRDIELTKLYRLADIVYLGGKEEIARLIEKILAGRPIRI
jgi:hypothetical protein